MKMATKSYKIIILLTVFIMSIAFAFGFMNTRSAYAEDKPLTVSSDVYDYFKLDKSFSARFNPDGLNLNVNKSNSIENLRSVKFLNDLIVNDLDIRMKLPASAETSFRFDLMSHYVNGNPKEYSKADTTYDTVIENIINMSYNADNTKVICKLNGVEVGEIAVDSEGYFTLQVRVKSYSDNKSYLTIGEFDIRAQYGSDQELYYQIKNIDDKSVATDIELDFRTGNETTETFILESVDQKASDETHAYKQSLKIPADESKLTLAKPRIYLNDSFYLRKADGEYTTVKIAYNKTYTLDITECSLFGGYGSLYLIKNDNVLLESNTSYPNEIQFLKEGSLVKFAVGGKQNDKDVVYEEFTVDEVKPFDYLDSEENTVPVYTYDEIGYKSFENAFKKATVVTSDDKETSIGMGTDFEIPSMKDLVSDDVTPYEDLATVVSYSTRTTETETTTMKFKVNDIGEYKFFVMFNDGKNKMNEKDFFTVDETDENKIEYNGIYKDYIFTFVIKDDADIIVKGAAVQGDGYLGVKYTASKFITDAEGRTLSYQLYYNKTENLKDADAEGWVLVPQASTISDTEYNEGGFDYDEVKEINYDGKLTFVPTRIGSYMIKCTASSSTSPREASAPTFINVSEKPTVVKVPSEWLQNNIWSVVFLGVGTLCLIGIIVLLCVKPKDQVDKD